MHRLLLGLMLFSNLLNPLSQTLASQECTLAGFAEHYIQVYPLGRIVAEPGNDQ